MPDHIYNRHIAMPAVATRQSHIKRQSGSSFNYFSAFKMELQITITSAELCAIYGK